MGNVLFEIREKGKWLEILGEIASDLGMVATLVDPQGMILLHAGDYPEICLRVRRRPQALSFVCGQSSQALMKQAERSRGPVVELCQIGLCKMVIPLFSGDRFLGAVASCSRALVGEELDPFLLSQELGIGEEEAQGLLASSGEIDEERVWEVARRWAGRLGSLMEGAP
ncbi:MAG: PocR ligand-binding domain-containing protein [Thermodesulfobacteriota bacterium]